MKTQAVVVANDPVYQQWLQGAAGTTMDVVLLPLLAFVTIQPIPSPIFGCSIIVMPIEWPVTWPRW